MMIKHVFKMIWNQRKLNAWIGAELLLISVVLWYVVDFMFTTFTLLYSPTGFDISHTYQVDFELVDKQSDDFLTAEQHPARPGDDFMTALDRIRTYPGVECVSVSMWGMPYSHGNGWAPLRADTLSKQAQVRFVTPDFFRVFRVHSLDGGLATAKRGWKSGSVLLSADVAAELFPGQEATGKELLSPFGDSVVVKVADVTTLYRMTEYDKPNNSVFLYAGNDDIIEQYDPGSMEVCLRVEADKDGADFAQTFRRQMKEQLRIGNLYLMDIRPVQDIADSYNKGRGNSNEVREYGAIAFFLLVNIFLGILGTFWFRTQGRKGEMGLRVALGSAPSRLQGLLIAEGLVLLTVSFAVAMLIALNITLTDLLDTKRMDLSVSRFLITAAITYVTMAVIIIAGIWYPAHQAARLTPAEALRYE
ncbi:ABC transporter permease [Parabacteroides bouchesdurhonensis]|uniref:ABC transporter permease n=1 Tax=Parabacteroides bouchesdurhonensis TaxID=1936995 RepID=UPI000C861E22|nr:FtsX-like permease family protein [Parabacteroides bouchesdurhonensis]